MGAHGGSTAWAYLRRNREYREAWAVEATGAAREDAPFLVRIQSAADLGAARFALFAWKDPVGDDGALSGFWSEAPMLDGELAAGAKPLLAMLAAAGARIEGLRLLDGSLILKIERGDHVDREGTARDAGGVREDRAGRRRGLARLHRPGP